jgi:hypothetical protein
MRSSLGGVTGYLVDLVDPPNVVIKRRLCVPRAAGKAPEVLLDEGEPPEQLVLVDAPRPPRPAAAEPGVEVPVHGLQRPSGARLLHGEAHVGRGLRHRRVSGLGNGRGCGNPCRRGGLLCAALGLTRLLRPALLLGVADCRVLLLWGFGLLRSGSLHGAVLCSASERERESVCVCV